MKAPEKKYKALILDVDGTLIPNQFNGMPSEKVTRAIQKASNLIPISIATGRPFRFVSHILSHLNLSGPSIVSGGAQIVDIKTGNILWQQLLNREDVLPIYTILDRLKIPCYVDDGHKDILLSKNYQPTEPFHIYTQAVSENKTQQAIDELKHIKTVSVHKIPSWQAGKLDIMINHTLATKQHGILEIAKILNIKTHDIIAVGDGYNDFPLLMACGLKIAMGNAVEELKTIADYIAPTVDEDGVATIIEKFVL